MSLLHRIRESLKYRLFYAYCRGCERRKRSCAPKINWPAAVAADLPPLLIVTCEPDVALLQYSLLSLQQTSAALPALWLVGDSPRAVALMKAHFLGAPRSVRITLWEDQLEELLPFEKYLVQTWVASKPWGGYARKFAATIAANRKSSILLSDADVLWKHGFLQTLQGLLATKPAILAGRDESYAYDRSLAEALHSRIFSAPPLNCGFVYYSRGVLGSNLQKPEYEITQPFVANASTHLEQTLMARAFEKAGGQYFQTDHVATTLSDNFCLREKVRSHVRHYAGAKHLFWRDA